MCTSLQSHPYKMVHSHELIYQMQSFKNGNTCIPTPHTHTQCGDCVCRLMQWHEMSDLLLLLFVDMFSFSIIKPKLVHVNVNRYSSDGIWPDSSKHNAFVIS